MTEADEDDRLTLEQVRKRDLKIPTILAGVASAEHQQVLLVEDACGKLHL